MLFRNLVLVLAVGLFAAVPASAQCQAAKFESPVSAPGTWFGEDVAFHGDTAAFGHSRRDNFTGAAYVAERADGVWGAIEELVPDDAQAGRWYGKNVDVDGDTIIVGAWKDNGQGSQSGAAYIFRKDGGGWTQEAKLSPDDAHDQHRFGWDVQIEGDTAYVSQGEQPGGLYVFEHQGGGVWQQTARLEPDGLDPIDGFAQIFSVRGDTLVAYSNDKQLDNSTPGSVYVYQRTAGVWSLEQELSASDAQDGSLFGIGLDVLGDTIVVGATNQDEFGIDRVGQAYLFERDAGVWTETQKLRPAWVTSGIHFGNGIAIDGDTILVGANADKHPDNTFSTGSVFMYRFDGVDWGYARRVFTDPPVRDAAFGESIALDGDTAVIGARLEGESGSFDGAAYVLDGFESEQVTLAVDPVVSYLELWISLPVFGDFHIVIPIVGEIVADITTDCGEPTSIQMVTNEFATEESVVTLDLGAGSSMTFIDSGIHMNPPIGDPDEPSPVDEFGGFSLNPIEQPFGTLDWTFFGIPGTINLDDEESDNWNFVGTLTPQGGGYDYEATVDPVVFVFDMGLGADNPTITYGAYVSAATAPPCEPDCDGNGLVDTRDVICFLGLWAAGDPLTDCDGNGLIDTRDVICFLGVWVAGC